MPPATRIIAVFAPEIVRDRKMPMRISGAVERRSMTTNSASSAIASAASASVRSSPQPKPCALTIA